MQQHKLKHIQIKHIQIKYVINKNYVEMTFVIKSPLTKYKKLNKPTITLLIAVLSFKHYSC